jgi:diacylglycerol O-acyltransferase / wax synthase
VTLSIADGGKPPPQQRKAKREPQGEQDWITGTLIKPFTELAAKGMEVLAHAGGPIAGSVDAARIGVQVAQDAAALALMSDDSPTRLKGKATPGKRVAWGEPLPLDDVKAVSKAYGVSINDVLLAAVAGAIGSYLRSQGDDPTGQEIRAMVPVNLRPLEEAYKLGNRFGLAPLVLPIGIAHPGERLYAVHARMNALKGSYQPLLAFAVLALSGLVVKPMQDAITGLFNKKTTAVMTNVPGPRERVHFCGRVVNQVMFWVPQSGDVGVGVSILSYAGGVQFGLITDARMCPDPEAIVERFAPEFEKLLLLALMSPWPVLA